MKLDDDGRPHAIVLDEAAETMSTALEHADSMAEDGGLWISHVSDDGKDRGERCLFVEITHSPGVCEAFRVSITRDIT